MRTNWAPLPNDLDASARQLVEELRRLKDSHDLTLAALGTGTHYSTSSWERWLNGRRLIARSALVSFAELTKADGSYLLALLDSSLRQGGTREEGAGSRAVSSSRPAPTPPDASIATARPFELPRDLPDYVGRDGEFATLVSALRNPDGISPPIWAVVGMGGLGKTSLAVRTAHRVSAFYPDGTVYLDLRGGSAAPLDTDAALLRLLRSLGVADSEIPTDVDGRAATLRSALAARRVLMLLDNVFDAAQVRPLLPGNPDCAVIITSRNLLAGLEGVQRIVLGALSHGESGALLARIVGAERFHAEPEAAEAMLAVCAGLPLALRIAGARLAVRPTWQVQTLTRKLQTAARALDELAVDDLAVRASFEASYRMLVIDDVELGEARSLKFLGLWEGGDISLPAAAALLDMSMDAAERELERLTDISLMQSPAPGRYRFHDLLHSFAAERARLELTAADQRAAISRLAAWYAHTAATATGLIFDGRGTYELDQISRPGHTLSFASADEAMGWYDAESGGLVSITRQARSLHLDSLATTLPQIFQSYLEARFKFDEWIETANDGLVSARRTGATLSEAHLETALATAYSRAGLHVETMAHAHVSLELYERLGDQLNQARAMDRVATAYKLAGDVDEACSWLLRAVDLFELTGYLYGAANSLNRLGMIYNDNGRANEAVDCLRRSLDLAERLGSKGAQAAVISNLGLAYRTLGRHQEALAAHSAADALFTDLGFELGWATNLVMMGNTLRVMNKTVEARDCLERALSTLERLGHQDADEARRALKELAAANVSG